MITKTSLLDEARDILAKNDHGDWTQPTAGLYPHQWLWDSCFIAMGASHYDPMRASREILSLFRGQWRNGMLPHIIFSEGQKYSYGPSFWDSKSIKGAPHNIATSGITQPPVVAIAAWEVAQTMPEKQRKNFLEKVCPRLVAYHKWIYNERDPEGSGLTVLMHPWETGLDNTPPWMYVMKRVEAHRSTQYKRIDTDFVSKEERPTDEEHKELVALALLHRKYGYDSKKIIENSPVVVQDIVFNSILVEANSALIKIARELDKHIPGKLLVKFRQTKEAINTLWDEETGQFYSRDFKTGKLLNIPTSSTFLPLYSGTVSEHQKEKLLELLFDPHKYWTQDPVPTVPADSVYFKPRCYWQGPVWINMNWFIIKGLKRAGLKEDAQYLLEKTEQLIEQSGFREYYCPLDGSGCGGGSFSWTAALAIDLCSATGHSRP